MHRVESTPFPYIGISFIHIRFSEKEERKSTISTSLLTCCTRKVASCLRPSSRLERKKHDGNPKHGQRDWPGPILGLLWFHASFPSSRMSIVSGIREFNSLCLACDVRCFEDRLSLLLRSVVLVSRSQARRFHSALVRLSYGVWDTHQESPKPARSIWIGG